MAEIVVKNLSVTYKGRKKSESVCALSSLDVKFESEKINVVLGYNGCGKSTLLKAIAGIIEYTGDIFLDGVNAYKMPAKNRGVSFVTENYILNPALTVFDNIALSLKTQKLGYDKTLKSIYELTEKLDIAHTLNCKPRQLSQGQQQRVAIAKALIKKPKICLFDEALTALDQKLRNELRLFIKSELKSYNATSVYVTHDLNEATAFGDKIFVLSDSKIALEGTPEEIIKSDNELIRDLKKLTFHESLLEGGGKDG